ncbi:hypothetical protein B0H13DRAFT_2394691 [Mycena leptocephala]|nr:hypothetical protein B0H13DRAFT_2394691 [Mycena leptocephala]
MAPAPLTLPLVLSSVPAHPVQSQPSALHFPVVRRHRGRTPLVILLLRRHAGGGLFYLDPHHSHTAAAVRPPTPTCAPCASIKSLVGARPRCARTRSGGGQRMHTARACDEGRTQSGGVRVVLTED